MDWGYKAALTGMTVAAVMMAARLFGQRVAGLLAGLPVMSAPALLWLAGEQGVDSAAHSALGSLAACVAAPVFVLTFARVAGRTGPASALIAAVLTLAASLALLQPLQDAPLALITLVLATAAGAWRWVVRQPVPATWVRQLSGEPWLSASLAAVVCATAAQVAPQVGAFWAGALAALPWISAFALVNLHRAGGPGALRGFIRGYVPGVVAKALFLVTFALTVSRVGTAWALMLAAAAGAAGVAAWTAGTTRPAALAALGLRAER